MAQCKVQLCGKLVVELGGERVEEALPGRQGRALFAFLTLNRVLTRDEVTAALWPQGRFHRAWGPAQVALFISRRPFLPGHDAEWVEEVRRSLAAVGLRALEAYGQAALGIGGTELAAAVRAGRELTRLEPYRESGYRVLMRALAAEGNTAEALRVYDDLRRLLHEELGTAPSTPTQDLHRRLLT